MNRYSLIICAVFCLSTSAVWAQKEASVWYFGERAGVSFKEGTAKALTNSLISTTEGCATLSDSLGNLLFYTDGITVWNRNHLPMPNGTALHGDPSSTQSAIIIPKPESKNLYYVFTVDKEAGDKGLKYSVVDMVLEAKSGNVTEKNTALKAPVTEKITAVKHRNNKDVWVITHDWKNNAFLAFLVSKNGVTKTPVLSNSGSIHIDSKGMLKASPDGSNLALAVEGMRIFELFDFDNQTGKVSNSLTLPLKNPEELPYGVEFSPDGSLLYGSAKDKIYQYNLQAGSATAIANSAKVIGSTIVKPDFSGWIGALQLGGDGKIYAAIFNQSYLAVINKPKEMGSHCDFKAEGFNLGGGICKLGIPTFAQNFFNQRSFDTTNISYFEEQAELGKRFILNHVLFESGKSLMRAESYPELGKLINLLNQKPDWKVEISGHTDNLGNKSLNIQISLERAKTVQNYLISKGIAPHRISSKGLGSSQPIADNQSAEGRQRNRRVEFILLN
jgi:outer membrane protein OmpA-like peptidoglycan-associated protein